MDQGQVQTATNRDAAVQSFKEAQDIVMSEVPWIPVMDIKTAYATRKGFGGFRPDPAYEYVVRFYECYPE